MRSLRRAARPTLLLAALGLAAGCARCSPEPRRAPDAGVDRAPAPLVERARQVDLRTAVFTALHSEQGVQSLVGRAGLLLQFATPDPEQAMAALEKSLVARGYQPPMPGGPDAGVADGGGSGAAVKTEPDGITPSGDEGAAGSQPDGAPVIGTWSAEPPGELALTRGRFVIEASVAPPGLHVSVDLPLFLSDIGKLRGSPASVTSDDLAREVPALPGATEVDRTFRVDLSLGGRRTTMHRLLSSQSRQLSQSGWTVVETRSEGPAEGGEGEGHQTRLMRSGALDSLSLSHRGEQAEVRYLQPLQVRP